MNSAAVSINEQFPEDGLPWSKHVAVKCDFNDILKYKKTVNGLCCIGDGNECVSGTLMQQDAQI
jgi:hypothetical protein